VTQKALSIPCDRYEAAESPQGLKPASLLARGGTAKAVPFSVVVFPRGNSTALAGASLSSTGGTSAGYHGPVQEGERDGCDQDQGLAEIYARYEDHTQDHAQYGQEISGGQVEHCVCVFRLLAAEDGHGGAAYGVVKEAGYGGEGYVPFEVAD
jgi:hypothetical protein